MTIALEKQLTPPGGWISEGGVRLPPLKAAEAGWVQKMMSSAVIRFGGVNASNLFLTLLRNPRIFGPWLVFAQTLMPNGQLDRRTTELAILRVAWNCRSRYEWGQHVDIGLRAGVSVEDIRRVAKGPEADGWDDTCRHVLRACDELQSDNVISGSTWSALAQLFDEKRLLELVMLINHYRMLAGVLNSFGVELDESIEKVLAKAPIHGSVDGKG